ncbi:MAG: hypothetical protein QM784_39965 [Polyangiaceae bacterium]
MFSKRFLAVILPCIGLGLAGCSLITNVDRTRIDNENGGSGGAGGDGAGGNSGGSGGSAGETSAAGSSSTGGSSAASTT